MAFQIKSFGKFTALLFGRVLKDPLGSVVFRWPRITEEAQEVVVRPLASRQL